MHRCAACSLAALKTQAFGPITDSLLELGIAYVQVPCSAVTLLTSELQPGRTVLSVPEDCKAIPPSFAGYLCTREVAAVSHFNRMRLGHHAARVCG
jgi:hypothetical protein